MAHMAKGNAQGRAPSQRQLRVAELIRRTLSEMLLRGDIHDPELAAMSVTIGEVTITPDLRIATVYALALGGGDSDLMIKALNNNRYELRRGINKALTLKFSPELRFKVDRTYDQMDDTRALLDRAEVRRDLDSQEDLNKE